MKIIDAILHAKRDGATGVIMTRAAYRDFLEEKRKVEENPSAFNRLTRRLHGFRGPAVPRGWFQPEMTHFVPRYIRRNWPKVADHRPGTRRERKIRARCLRIATAHGLR